MIKTILPLAGLLLAAPALAVTPISATVSVGSSVRAGELFDQDGRSTTFLPEPGQSVRVGRVAEVGDFDNPPYASAFSSSASEWQSAALGLVRIRWSWGTWTPGFDDPVTFDTSLANPNFSYTFTARNNGFFQASYTLSTDGDGPVDGLGRIRGGGALDGLLFGGSDDDPAGTGQFSIPLLAGQTYTVTLANSGRTTSSNRNFDSIATFEMRWQITGAVVPEPGTWAMMIASFGMVGAALRRRAALPA